MTENPLDQLNRIQKLIEENKTQKARQLLSELEFTNPTFREIRDELITRLEKAMDSSRSVPIRGKAPLQTKTSKGGRKQVSNVLQGIVGSIDSLKARWLASQKEKTGGDNVSVPGDSTAQNVEDLSPSFWWLKVGKDYDVPAYTLEPDVNLRYSVPIGRFEKELHLFLSTAEAGDLLIAYDANNGFATAVLELRAKPRTNRPFSFLVREKLPQKVFFSGLRKAPDFQTSIPIQRNNRAIFFLLLNLNSIRFFNWEGYPLRNWDLAPKKSDVCTQLLRKFILMDGHG